MSDTDEETVRPEEEAHEPSPRERAQQQVADEIEGRREVYTAPYGVICDKRRLERGGYIRSVTFGIARTLDATINVWGPDHLTVHAEGRLAHLFDHGNKRLSMAEVLGIIAQFDKRRDT